MFDRLMFRPLQLRLVLWLLVLLVLSLTGLFWNVTAHAFDVRVSWTWPTQQLVDGQLQPLAYEGISHYLVEYGTCVQGADGKYAFGVRRAIVKAQRNWKSRQVADLPAGIWCIRLYTVDVQARPSDPTSVVAVEYRQLQP